MKYAITGKGDHADYGTYEADSPEAALRMMAEEANCSDLDPDKWIVEEFTERTCANGYHDYNAVICPACGAMFCESCASEVIYEPTSSVLRCPKCLHNYYDEEK